MAQLVKPIHWLTTDDRLLHGCAGKEQYDSFAAADMIRKRRSKKGEAAATDAKWAQEVLKAKAVTEAEQQRDVAALIAARDKAVAETAALRDKAVAETNAARDKSVAETAAQRDLEVAQLAAQAAEQYKQKLTLEGEGEAAKRTLVMAADGALAQKLDAWTKSQEYWANAFSNYKGEVVPRIVSGSATGQTTNGMTDFMAIMGMKAANDLALDMSVGAKK